MTILILGGTSEARDIAARLTQTNTAAISSLAGRVQRPRLPVGEVRIGGFGGVAGMCAYYQSRQIRVVIDATHPFAEGITANAIASCTKVGIPLLRLERPGWTAAPGSDSWHWVADHDKAADLAARLGSRPFLTTGRQSLEHFTGPLAHCRTLVRVVDVPDIKLPGIWTLLTSRGPYERATEEDLMHTHGADVLVTKDSGGTFTWPKMEAAQALGIPIVVVRRTPGAARIATVSGVAEAIDWLSTQ